MKLERLREICAARTGGEWGFFNYGNCLEAKSFAHHGHNNKKIIIAANHPNKGDAVFIAAMVNHADALMETVELAKAFNERLIDAGLDDGVLSIKLQKALKTLEDI